MKEKLLYLLTILCFIIGCNKDDDYYINNSKSILQDLLLKHSKAESPKNEVSDYCKRRGQALFNNEEVTLYNDTYQKLLTAEGSTAGTWDGALVFLDRWYIGPMWKHAQQWSFNSDVLPPKYGGWVYSISNKIGWGKWRDLAIDNKKYFADNPKKKTYPVKLFAAPGSGNAGIFEFIITECYREGRHPRGLLVHRGTDRLVQVKEEDYSREPVVLFGEKYNPAKKNKYDHKFLWEAEPRGLK